MKLRRSGFTLVEIAIFLAITGLLFAGIAVGTSNSIRQQRFTDSVQNFAEFLRGIYSGVSNPQSSGDGRSENAIYGKLVTFGETYALDGSNNTENKIFAYDVVGNVSGEFGSGGLSEVLYNLGANVRIDGEVASFVESYKPKWATKIENTDNSNSFVGALLVVRNPKSGTIMTLAMKGQTVEVNKTVQACMYQTIPGMPSGVYQYYCSSSVPSNPLADVLKAKKFSVQEVDFCVDPNENFNQRQNVRIVANAHNAAGVEIISLDGSENRCRK
ncbi:prepilin-type N-terminal cleavage/methylation domain-containing protein [Candidatus Saccharibacteria bacterium]|nr:prepilin-type N-terminal cleavage/methylation domain-containing protein [Candidatus Saccharibacteria bacterium]MBR3332514.1 prepilin-type N-terminal cleavage/methylation domain-containing protein [Candidatus Saccharibacteria bacterium]